MLNHLYVTLSIMYRFHPTFILLFVVKAAVLILVLQSESIEGDNVLVPNICFQV